MMKGKFLCLLSHVVELWIVLVSCVSCEIKANLKIWCPISR